jgi:hypothetical protein
MRYHVEPRLDVGHVVAHAPPVTVATTVTTAFIGSDTFSVPVVFAVVRRLAPAHAGVIVFAAAGGGVAAGAATRTPEAAYRYVTPYSTLTDFPLTAVTRSHVLPRLAVGQVADHAPPFTIASTVTSAFNASDALSAPVVFGAVRRLAPAQAGVFVCEAASARSGTAPKRPDWDTSRTATKAANKRRAASSVGWRGVRVTMAGPA